MEQNKEREALKMVTAFCKSHYIENGSQMDAALNTLRDALTPPRQMGTDSAQTDELRSRFPEINFSNYGQDEVEALQAWAFEAYDMLAAPPQAAPVAQGLTDEEIEGLIRAYIGNPADGLRNDCVRMLTAVNRILAQSAPHPGHSEDARQMVASDSAQQAEPHGGNLDEATAKAILAFVNRPGDTYNGYVRRQLGLGFALALKRAIERAQAATAAPAPVASPDEARFRWLTDDLAGDEREARNRLLERMAVMSYSASCDAIDEAMRVEEESK